MRVHPADCDDGDGDGPANPPELIVGHVHSIRLGDSWMHGAHPQIVCARIPGSQGLLDRLRGDADDCLLAEKFPGLGAGEIVLSYMHAVCPNLPGELHVVIDNEGDAGTTAYRKQAPGKLQPLSFVRGLLSELDEGGASLDCLVDALLEGPAPKPHAVSHRIEHEVASDCLLVPSATRHRYFAHLTHQSSSIRQVLASDAPSIVLSASIR